MRKGAALAVAPLLVAPMTAVAQTAPARPGPGDPLPPFTFDNRTGVTTLETVTDPITGRRRPRVRIDGGVSLLWGDLRLRADRLLYDPADGPLHAEAVGGVTLTRGDERVSGRAFVFDGARGLFTVQDGLLSSPPLIVQGRTLTRSATEIRAREARVGIGTPDGRPGELQFRAADIFVGPVPGDPPGVRRLFLKDAGVYLYGTRLFTLRRASLRLRESGRNRRTEVSTFRTPPVGFRVSRISGVAFGLALPVAPGPGITGVAQFDRSSRQGFQYALRLRRDLLGPADGPPPRRGIAAAAPGGVDPSVAGLSPIRQLLKARPLPPPPDPVLDFEDILTTQNPVETPTRAGARDLSLTLETSGNREFGFRRQGGLLLSRLPEATLSARLPLAGPVPPSPNGAARAALARPRLALVAELTAGRYDEVRLDEDRRSLRAARLGGALGLATEPLLIGAGRTLAQGSVTYRTYTYGDRGGSVDGNRRAYGYWESQLTGAYVLGYRTAFGASYIARDVAGATPFYWDQVDTQSEAQVRAQTVLGPSGRFTLAGLARYDAAQRRFFDFEIGLAVRGRNIEPRFSYRKLNSQFGFTVALPGLEF